MKLTYRGVSYEYNPPVVEMGEETIVGKYRGLDWRFRNPKRVLVLDSNLDLKYRGAAYRRTAQLPVTVHKTPALSVFDKARVLMIDTTRSEKNRQMSMLTRLTAELR